MSDKEAPDIDDIDAFLLNDHITEASTTDLPKLVVSNAISNERAVSKLVRLEHRMMHASRSLTTALSDKESWHAALDTDQAYSNEFAHELESWEAVMTDLEAAARFIPEATQAEDTDQLHEDVAAVIASNFDAEILAVAEKEDMFEKLISPDDGNELIDDDDATVNRNQHDLLQALVAQEQRIKELESRLQQASAEQSDEPAVSAAETEASDPYVNRLIVVVNGNENMKFPLSQNIMTIGREPHNDIHIRSRYISRFHARIVSDQQGSTVEDLDSRNGISVNAEKVRRKQLRSGDLIDLGRVQLKFIDLMEGTASEGQA